MPERQYQYAIVQAALLHNTLVCLPTGLGKTFIAAVVMYNFWRWFPRGRVVFMAPTRPLVAQQVHACQAVMGLPRADIAELTGQTPQATRVREWQRARVFFVTPHVLQNDMVAGQFPTHSVVCLVVDEAHRATGNYAFCEVLHCLDPPSACVVPCLGPLGRPQGGVLAVGPLV